MGFVLSQPNGVGGCECPCKCHALFGETLDAVVSGVTECLTCFQSGGAGFGFVVQFVGVNGGHSIPYIGGESWQKNIGLSTLTIWNNGDSSCDGDPIAVENPQILLSISCDISTNLMSGSIIIPASGSLGGFISIFGSSGNIDTLWVNTLTFADCSTQPNAVVGYDGAMIVSTP